MATKTKTEKKVPIKERALMERINRKLKQQGEVLRRFRGHIDRNGERFPDTTLGWYYIEERDSRMLVTGDVDLETVALELGVLRPYEKLADD